MRNVPGGVGVRNCGRWRCAPTHTYSPRPRSPLRPSRCTQTASAFTAVPRPARAPPAARSPPSHPPCPCPSSLRLLHPRLDLRLRLLPPLARSPATSAAPASPAFPRALSAPPAHHEKNGAPQTQVLRLPIQQPSNVGLILAKEGATLALRVRCCSSNSSGGLCWTLQYLGGGACHHHSTPPPPQHTTIARTRHHHRLQQ